MPKDNFFQDVWDVTKLIPKGRVTSYGAIAKYLGTKMSARMVGWALASCSGDKESVPAWRVVNRIGMLSGAIHFETPTKMQELLELEGVTVKDNQVVDLSKVYWDPAIEL